LGIIIKTNNQSAPVSGPAKKNKNGKSAAFYLPLLKLILSSNVLAGKHH